MTQELLGLHNLQKNQKATKSRVRRGRGNSSGHGNYSGRGMKGQKSRSGGKSGLKVRGLRNYLLRIPKSKGFTSDKPNNFPINLEILDRYFENNEVVSLKSLVKKNLIPVGMKNVKILASGNITKKLVIKIDSLSAKAKEAIIKAGGEILEIKDKATYNIRKDKTVKVDTKEMGEVETTVKKEVPKEEKVVTAKAKSLEKKSK